MVMVTPDTEFFRPDLLGDRFERGWFSEDGLEFILTDPLLEKPWANILTNGRWAFVMEHQGTGYSVLDNPTVGRITRLGMDGQPRTNRIGKFTYLRDEDSGEWWNANGFPATPERALERWQAHIGLGYTTIRSQHKGILAEQTYFAPMVDLVDGKGDPCLVWKIRLTNTSAQKRSISATNYTEPMLGSFAEDQTWRQFHKLMNRQAFDRNVMWQTNLMWVRYTGAWQSIDSNNGPFDHHVFLASSADVRSYHGDRESFYGPQRDLADPAVFAENDGQLGNKLVADRIPCMALQQGFELLPGQSADYVVVMGAIPVKDMRTADMSPDGRSQLQAEDALPLTGKYLTVEAAEGALAKTREFWQSVVATPRIETPDALMDLMINVWSRYQAKVLGWWNRNVGHDYSGIYGISPRDSFQDVVGSLATNPRWVRQRILEVARWQYDDGRWAHSGNPVSLEGSDSPHSDDPLNVLFALNAYVRETGDYTIFQERVPWLDRDTGRVGSRHREPSSLLEHVLTGIDKFFQWFEADELPPMQIADWNDALDQTGGRERKGESAMLACWAVYCLENFFPIVENHLGPKKLASYRDRAEKLKETVRRECWTGEYYWRVRTHEGEILGKPGDRYFSLVSTVNSMAIFSGVATPDQVPLIAKSLHSLYNDYGVSNFRSTFLRPDTRAGVISRFAPGVKENNANQQHNAMWVIRAMCAAGRGDLAYEAFQSMNPMFRFSQDPKRYKIEPYVYSQFIQGPDSDHPGEGSHAWSTGSACWAQVNALNWMLGVRPEIIDGQHGLYIDPCLPPEWQEVSMDRRFRDADYQIKIHKRPGVMTGVDRITVDGQPILGQLLPLPETGHRYNVEVFMGR